MSQIESKTCPICNDTYDNNNVRILENGVTQRVDCERCGTYDIDKAYSVAKPWSEVSHLVSAWIRQQNNAGIKPVIPRDTGVVDAINHESWENRFRYMGFPENIIDKLDALLLAYAATLSGDYLGRINKNRPDLISTIGAKDINEIKGLTNLLREMGHLSDVERAHGALTISAQGWLHIDELRKTNAASNTAFVAMWFDDVTKKYRESVIAAIHYCKFESIIIDQKEFNDFIMNQVVSSIRRSRFLIADYTSRPEIIEKDGKVRNGVRGGVYWEAGMAYGLGIPVIITCESSKESLNRIHFDIGQYKRIEWKENELSTEIRPLDQSMPNPNFAEKLAMHIRATIGQGSYSPNK